MGLCEWHHAGLQPPRQADRQCLRGKLQRHGPARVPRANVTRGKTRRYTEYYSERTRAIVASRFAIDIEYFGYRFGEYAAILQGKCSTLSLTMLCVTVRVVGALERTGR